MSEESDHHRLRVTAGEVTVEVEGDKEFVEEQFAELEEEYLDEPTPVETTSGESESGSPGGFVPGGSEGKPLTLSEIGREIDLPYKRDAALLTGWYLEHVEGMDEFTRSDIEEKAKESKVELGANVPRDISTLVERGLLVQVGQRESSKTYYTTRTGEEYVLVELGVEEL
jgi:hypothetical protein